MHIIKGCSILKSWRIGSYRTCTPFGFLGRNLKRSCGVAPSEWVPSSHTSLPSHPWQGRILPLNHTRILLIARYACHLLCALARVYFTTPLNLFAYPHFYCAP
jgi:hypothetical protein